jgi:hypothetical protein
MNYIFNVPSRAAKTYAWSCRIAHAIRFSRTGLSCGVLAVVIEETETNTLTYEEIQLSSM